MKTPITSMETSVKIGKQEWTNSNLKVTKFSNGDLIPLAQNDEEWDKLGKERQPACAYFAYDSKNGEKLGLLYNWYAVTDKRGLAPDGWVVPSTKDWKLLLKEMGGVKVAGGELKKEDAWEGEDNSNSSGFSAIPGGFHDEYGNDNCLDMYGCFWSTSIDGENDADYIMFSSYSNQVNVRVRGRAAGFSVRLIKSK